MVGLALARGLVLTWATRSQVRALANARSSATQCARRRVERAEIDALLARVALDLAPARLA